MHHWNAGTLRVTGLGPVLSRYVRPFTVTDDDYSMEAHDIVESSAYHSGHMHTYNDFTRLFPEDTHYTWLQMYMEGRLDSFTGCPLEYSCLL
jgi:hypothetical protein